MIAALVVHFAALIAQPRIATCARGAFLDGVRADGSFECVTRVYVTNANDSAYTETRTAGRVRCAAGERPWLVDERTAGCRAVRS